MKRAELLEWFLVFALPFQIWETRKKRESGEGGIRVAIHEPSKSRFKLLRTIRLQSRHDSIYRKALEVSLRLRIEKTTKNRHQKITPFDPSRYLRGAQDQGNEVEVRPFQKIAPGS